MWRFFFYFEQNSSISSFTFILIFPLLHVALSEQKKNHFILSFWEESNWREVTGAALSLWTLHSPCHVHATMQNGEADFPVPSTSFLIFQCLTISHNSKRGFLRIPRKSGVQKLILPLNGCILFYEYMGWPFLIRTNPKWQEICTVEGCFTWYD